MCGSWTTCHPFITRSTIPAQGLYSLSGKTSYRKILGSLEAARFGFKLFQSLWNLAGISAALLPRCLSNFRAMRPLQHPISRLREFTRFSGKTSYRLVNRGPVSNTNAHSPLPASHYWFIILQTGYCLICRPTTAFKLNIGTVVKHKKVPAGYLIKMAPAVGVDSARLRSFIQSVEVLYQKAYPGKYIGI